MDYRIMQANDWLKNEIKKDQLDIEESKKRDIKQIKSIDRNAIISKTKKRSVFAKLLYILGWK